MMIQMMKVKPCCKGCRCSFGLPPPQHLLIAPGGWNHNHHNFYHLQSTTKNIIVERDKKVGTPSVSRVIPNARVSLISMISWYEKCFEGRTILTSMAGVRIVQPPLKIFSWEMFDLLKTLILHSHVISQPDELICLQWKWSWWCW